MAKEKLRIVCEYGAESVEEILLLSFRLYLKRELSPMGRGIETENGKLSQL